jgi:hypothetical protein
MTMNAGTIAGNEATGNGGGIYLVEGSVLELSGSPSFGTDGNQAGTGDDAKRQDIYIAGYLGTNGGDGEDKDDPKLADSLIVTGALNVDKGSIWVGAEVADDSATDAQKENNHWDSLKQFAKFADTDTLMKADGTVNLTEAELTKVYEAFRNATTSDEYYGMSGDGQTGGVQCIYWEGVQGSRKVILRKVDSTFKSVKDMTFVVYKGSSTTPYINRDGTTRTQLGGTQISTEVPVEPMKSLDSGVFWIGKLPYGWYIIEETSLSPSTYFYLVVTANGIIEGPKEAGGTTNRSAAETAAAALYTANK